MARIRDIRLIPLAFQMPQIKAYGMARRLVAAGVRFVTINTFLTVFDGVSWDIHGSKPFASIEQMKTIVCPLYDQAYSALIEDLARRGMLDTTLVCNLAEFGRTPRINPAGGPAARMRHECR